MSGKTHKGIKKRFKTTATGKVVRQAAGRRHLMSTKSGRRSQRLRKPVVLDKQALKPLERQYGKL